MFSLCNLALGLSTAADPARPHLEASVATPLNRSLLKGFEILSLISEDRHEISVATVVECLGTNAATAHRFLMTLERAGALRPTTRGRYGLGPKLEEFGRLAEETGSLAASIQPEIDGLCKALGESVMVCRPSRLGPACIAVANSARPISVNIRVGTVLPLHSTAQGRIVLAEMPEGKRRARLSAGQVAGSPIATPDHAGLDAELEQIRTQGYALNLGDNEPDIAAVAVPARNADGRTVLTVSAFGMLSRFDDLLIDSARKGLLEVAARIGRSL